jgi:tetratricopeptide (TPR) repeat protein
MQMSIGNKMKLFVLPAVFLLASAIAASALSIRVVEGGIPLVDPQEMIEEGIRKGSVDLLRQAWRHYEDSLLFNEKEAKTAYLELGKIYFHLSLLGYSTQSEFDTAEHYAREAVARDPENSDAHRALGLIFAGRGAFLDAYEELTLALYLNPGNEFLVYDLAALHLALRQPAKTIEYLEGRNHKNGWPYVVLAMAWTQQEQRGKAILNLLKAKRLGYSGYWVDTMLAQLSEEVKLPLNR